METNLFTSGNFNLFILQPVIQLSVSWLLFESNLCVLFQLPFVHGVIRRFAALTTLKLDFNELTVLPSGVGYMSSLR